MTSYYFYTAYNLGIQSSMHFPEMLSLKSNVDIIIKEKKLGTTTKKSKINEIGTLSYTRSFSQDICFTLDEEPLFRVKNGKEILINSENTVNKTLLRSLVLGQGFGTLLHQRGYTILHCSAVEINGNVIAFGGFPQSGKSTIVAALNKKGNPLITDDVMAIKFDSENRPFVLPGFPRIKLYEEVIEYITNKNNSFEKIHPKLKKFSFTAKNKFKLDILPLKVIYLLERSNKNEIIIKKPQETLIELIQQSYLINLFEDKERSQNIHQCAKILENTHIKHLKRENSLKILPSLIKLIEEDLNSEKYV